VAGGCVEDVGVLEVRARGLGQGEVAYGAGYGFWGGWIGGVVAEVGMVVSKKKSNITIYLLND